MMKRTRLIIFFVFMMGVVSAQKKNQSAGNCVHANTIALKLNEMNNFSDLNFLKETLKDKRIVLLGESSHGIGDYYTFKSRLIRFLHQEMGFEVLAMESGIADVYLQYKKTDSLTALQLRNSTVYGNFQCREVLPLFEYIKSVFRTTKPLIYAGFDSQNFTASYNLLQTILKKYSKTETQTLIETMNKYYRIPSLLWQTDKAPLYALGDSIKNAAAMALDIVQQNETAIRSEYHFSEEDMFIFKKGIMNLRESVTVDWEREDPTAKRDSLMADNLFWLMEKMYPGKKIIVWAHNGHIGITSAIGGNLKWMGEYIREKLGSRSYHIGLFAKEGKTYEWWTKTNKPFNNNGMNDIEHILSGSGKAISFLNVTALAGKNTCAWLNKPVTAFELENGGKISFIPAKRFDAVISFRKVQLPTYK